MPGDSAVWQPPLLLSLVVLNDQYQDQKPGFSQKRIRLRKSVWSSAIRTLVLSILLLE